MLEIKHAFYHLVFFTRRNSQLLAGIAFVVLAFFIFYFLSGGNEEPEQTKIADSIFVEDQKIILDSVIVKKISLSRDGFVVIHNSDSSGTTGKIIGYSMFLKAGTYNDLIVRINENEKWQNHKFVAMVHFDNGDGKPDFGEGGAGGSKKDGLVLMKFFNISAK